MGKLNQLAEQTLGLQASKELKAFNKREHLLHGNTWTGKFKVEVMKSEPAYGDAAGFYAFEKAVETDKFVNVGGRRIATHQITAFYLVQRPFTNDELMEILKNPITKNND